MENYKGGLKGYWKRRAYNRLDGQPGNRRARRSRVELGGGGGGGPRRKFWRIKISPRLRLFSRIRRFNPKRIFARIRDAYVRMMIGFANSGAISGGFGYGGQAVSAFGRPHQIKEYDEKMIIQIYRSLLTQNQLVSAAADPAGVPPAIPAVPLMPTARVAQ